MIIKKLVTGALCSLIFACTSVDVAQQAEKDPAVVSGFTGLYASFSCDQLYSEARRIAAQMEILATEYSDEVERSRLEFVGGVVYWPVLLVVNTQEDDGLAEEYGQLKGRMDSLTVWMADKSCAG
ncbi:MAG: hypothetical protein QGG88_00700 [Gammaproteobacteria bacterium]|jgi:hypothetical protein|nr:hypothetical protein [Gammaproteobacteria bacterium]